MLKNIYIKSSHTNASLLYRIGEQSFVLGAFHFMNKEIYKPIKSWEGLYEISNKGNVKSVAGVTFGGHGKRQMIVVPERIRAFTSLNNGYCAIRLAKRPRQENFLVHRLVADHFIPNPLNKQQVNHIDGNKSNNNVENLEWCTPSENCVHSAKKGRACASPVLTNNEVMQIFNSKDSLLNLAKKHGISKLRVQSIKSGKRYSSVTGKEYNGRKY